MGENMEIAQKKRQVISSLLIISMIIVVITGIALYIAPSKEIAFINHWNIGGIERGLFVDVHVLFGFITVAIFGYLLFTTPSMFWKKEKKAGENENKKG